MSDALKEESKKTIVSFVVGLLIGGILVWAFTGGERAEAPTTQDNDETEATTNDEVKDENVTINSDEKEVNKITNNLPMSDGVVVVDDQVASARIVMASASYPIGEGWIGVRDYTNENLGGILGVVRFSEVQGLVPKDIILQRPTIAGKTYAVIIFTENGDRVFNSATDVQLPTIFTTFTAK